MSSRAAMVRMPMHLFIKNGALYVPEDKREDILRLYGGHTILDLDTLFQFGEKIPGEKISGSNDCFSRMIVCMNKTDGDMRDQWEKLPEGYMRDVFNILQSLVRTRLGEQVWYQ